MQIQSRKELDVGDKKGYDCYHQFFADMTL